MKFITLLAVLLAAGCCGSAEAQSVLQGGEIRGGIYAHSFDRAGPGGAMLDFTRIEDVNVELKFAPLLDFHAWGTIAPNVGATVNFGGLESMIYGGMVWHVPVAATPFFTEAALGAALHNGALSGATAPARNLGCSLLFHEQLSLGANLSPSTSVMLTAEHASSANLCLPNEGLTNIGVRVGFKF